MARLVTAQRQLRDRSFCAARKSVRSGSVGSIIVVALVMLACGGAAVDGPTATPSAAALRIVTGDLQNGVVAHQLPEALTVRLQDVATGQAIAGRDVEFVVRTGGGTVLTVMSKTNARGEAATYWTLGKQARDTQRVEARSVDPATGVQSSILFSAVGRPDAALKVASSGGNSQTGMVGEYLVDSVFAAVVDQYANPISGLMARWQVVGGGGRVTPDSQLTDANGRTVVRWQMGTGDPLGVVRVRFAGQDTLAQAVFTAFAAGFLATQLVGGDAHTCGLTPQGVTYCWGAGISNLGPVQMSSAPTFTSLTALSRGQCGLTSAGALWCWGNDSTMIARAPAQVTAPALTQIAGGHYQLCGTTAAGAVYCGWPDSTAGLRSVAGLPVTRTLGVSGGGHHACGISDAGDAYCWGNNEAGQLGDSSNAARSAPVRVSGGHKFSAVSLGVGGTCALATDGQVFCWGANRSGNHGFDPTTFQGSNFPIAVPTASRFDQLTSGASSTCGRVSATKEVMCWGSNAFGQAGEGAASPSPNPVPFPVISQAPVASLMSQASGDHHCLIYGLTPYCWGANASGQVGNGTTTDAVFPGRVVRPSVQLP